jgi:hypothetical protein
MFGLENLIGNGSPEMLLKILRSSGIDAQMNELSGPQVAERFKSASQMSVHSNARVFSICGTCGKDSEISALLVLAPKR